MAVGTRIGTLPPVAALVAIPNIFPAERFATDRAEECASLAVSMAAVRVQPGKRHPTLVALKGAQARVDDPQVESHGCAPPEKLSAIRASAVDGVCGGGIVYVVGRGRRRRFSMFNTFVVARCFPDPCQ